MLAIMNMHCFCLISHWLIWWTIVMQAIIFVELTAVGKGAPEEIWLPLCCILFLIAPTMDILSRDTGHQHINATPNDCFYAVYPGAWKPYSFSVLLLSLTALSLATKSTYWSLPLLTLNVSSTSNDWNIFVTRSTNRVSKWRLWCWD